MKEKTNRTNTPILSIDTETPEPELIGQAVSVLAAGDMLIVPTDTVYGIGLLASDSAKPDRLFASKHRPAAKSIPLLVASTEDLQNYGCNLPAYARELASRHWPGALTLVIQASDKVPKQFVASDGSVALRMPDSTIILALLASAEAPIACSSANLSGNAPALSVFELDADLMDSADLIIDGGTLTGGAASAVVSCLQAEPQVLRPGPVTI